MKIKTLTFAIALTALPSFAFAMGCARGHGQDQAMSCAQGSAYDSATDSCLPVNT